MSTGNSGSHVLEIGMIFFSKKKRNDMVKWRNLCQINLRVKYTRILKIPRSISKINNALQ